MINWKLIMIVNVVGLTFLVLGGALFLTPSASLGLMLGGLLMAGNFIALKLLFGRLVRGNRKLGWIWVLAFVKLAGFLGLAWVSIWYLHADHLAFGLGAAAVVMMSAASCIVSSREPNLES